MKGGGRRRKGQGRRGRGQAIGRRRLVRRHDDVKVGHVGEQLRPHQLPLVAVARVEPHDAQLRDEALELVDPR